MKNLKTILIITLLSITFTSCSKDEIIEPDTCSTDVSSIVGVYKWSHNENVVLTIANNATMSYRQDGVSVGFSTICIDGGYINATDIYDQESSIQFGFVLNSDNGAKLGIVLDGDVYYNL